MLLAYRQAAMALPRSLARLGLRQVPSSSYQELPTTLLARGLSTRMPRSGSRNPEPSRSTTSGFLEQFPKSLLPETFGDSIPRQEKRGFEDAADPNFKKTLVRKTTVMLRKQLISSYLPEHGNGSFKGVKSQERPNLVVVHGLKGVGKTSILEQTAAFARLKGFIVLYIPNPAAWTDGRSFFSPTAVEGMDPLMDGTSAVRYYNRPHQMHDVFKVLIQMHSDDLALIECHPDFATELTENCASVLDLVQLGDRLLNDLDSNWRQTPSNAGEIFHQVIRELCACEDKPVAIIIDNYDKFIGLTCMANERRQRLHSNCIRAVAEHFGRDAIENTAENMVNGFVMLATDPSHAFESWRKSRLRSGQDFPLSEAILADPSGKQWVSDFRERMRDPEAGKKLLVEVPQLSHPELKALCSTFVQGGLRRLIDGEQEMETARLIALAGGRGDLMRKIVVSR